MSKVDIIKQNKKVAIIIATFIVILIVINVDEVTILEPNDKGIVAHKILPDNLCHRIVSIMKQSTQEYYNMRMLLDLKFQ